MRVPNIWNIAAILSVTTMLFSFFFALAYLDPATFNFNPEIFAMIGFFIGFLYILAPIPALEKRKTKRFLRRSLWRQIRSPFSRVEFIDFFLADQWFVYVLFSISVSQSSSRALGIRTAPDLMGIATK